MDDLIAAAAAQMGISAEMAERSARARAAADGTSIEAILAAWTGAEAPPAGAAPAPTAAPAPAPAAAAPAPAPAAQAAPAVEELPPVVAGEPEPAEEPEPEPEEEEEPVPVGAVPRWLAAVFIIVPVVALAYAMFVPNGPDCGEGGQLAVDPVTGVAVNCDGSEYGSDVVDFFSIGQAVYQQCAACHGSDGAGGAQFPAFTDGAVLATFPAGECANHVEWVRVGTAGWPDATYGANSKPVGGSGAQMPAFGNALSEDELRAVIVFERVAFGGQPETEAISDCGLGEADEAVAAG